MQESVYNPNYKEEISVTIVINGEEKECFIVAISKGKYGRYIALLPKEKEYIISAKMLLFKLISFENNIPAIETIEDDAEYDYASDILQEIIADQNLKQLIEKYKDNYK